MSERIVILSHFDTHGTVVGALLGRKLGVDIYNVIARFPLTGPAKFHEIINNDEIMKKIASADTVYIIDIPVNIFAPQQFIDAVREIAKHAKVVYVDHHATDKQYEDELKKIPNAEVKIVDNFKDFYEALFGPIDNFERPYIDLAVVAHVADRDPTVTQYALEIIDPDVGVDIDVLIKIANRLDVLVRKDPEKVKQLVYNAPPDVPLVYIYDNVKNIEYPPEKLADEILSRGGNIIDWGPVLIVKELDGRKFQQWIPKTLEQVLLETGKKIIIADITVNDRRTGKPVRTVQVLQLWTDSSLPAPETAARALGVRYIGHEKYVSVPVNENNYDEVMRDFMRFYAGALSALKDDEKVTS